MCASVRDPSTPKLSSSETTLLGDFSLGNVQLLWFLFRALRCHRLRRGDGFCAFIYERIQTTLRSASIRDSGSRQSGDRVRTSALCVSNAECLVSNRTTALPISRCRLAPLTAGKRIVLSPDRKEPGLPQLKAQSIRRVPERQGRRRRTDDREEKCQSDQH